MSHKRRDGAEKRREDESYKSISCSDVVEVFPEETSIERHKNGSILFLQDQDSRQDSRRRVIIVTYITPKFSSKEPDVSYSTLIILFLPNLTRRGNKVIHSLCKDHSRSLYQRDDLSIYLLFTNELNNN